MPTIGEIRKARDIGYKATNNYIWVACPDCGKERWVRKAKRQSSSCASCSAHKTKNWPTGERSYLWKGGKTINHNGYIMVILSRDNFFFSMAGSNRYVMEHRLVMAKALGRCLHSWEIVHHKNHIRDDNWIENLQLVSDDKHKQITILENRIEQLEKEVKLLKWQIKELNKIQREAIKCHKN